MPKIPIIPPRDFRDRSAGLGDGPEPLSPEQADALKAIEDRTARIDRELVVSQAWRAGVERLSEAEEMPGGAPVGFTRGFLDELDRERQQLVTALPPAGQEPLERDLLDLRADFLDRAAQVEASGMALRRRTALYDALDGYVAGVTRDPGQIDRAAGRMDSLIAGLALPEDRQGAMRLFVKDVLGNAAVDGLMQDPVRAERVMSDGLYDDVLSVSSRTQRLKEAQEKVARDRHLTRERSIAELVAQAHDGATSDEAIRQAHREQRLSPADVTYLIETNAQAAEAARTRDARIRRVASATERLNPSNPEDRAAGSDYWDSVSEVYALDDPKARQENELRFIERTGVLPQALENKYRGALLSMDAAVAVQGARVIARLASLDPALVQGIPAEEVRRAQAINSYTLLGVAPDRSIELGDEKLAAESTLLAGSKRSGEIQVAANDEPPVMSDATAAGGPDGGTAEQENDGAGIQPDGSVVIVDPETDERTTVDRESVDRVKKLADDQAALTAIRERFLEIYDAVASKEMTREEAAAALHAILEAPDGPTISDPTLRKELERVASDIPYAADREAASNVFAQRLLSPERSEEIGRAVLSLLPVVGEVVSAVEAYEAFSAALDAWRHGDKDEALRQAGEGGLATLGALPIAGRLVNLTRGGIKVFRKVRQLLGREKRSSVASAEERAPSTDGLSATDAVKSDVDYSKHLDLDDPRLITDTEYPFSMWRKERYKTNRQLIRDWEEFYGKVWPIDPETGRRMDVHHVIALADGGPDHFSNIVPMTHSEHIEHHKSNGDFERWRGRRR